MEKNKIKTCLIALSCLLLLGGGLTACNGNPSSQTTTTEPQDPAITISNGESASLEVGKTLQLDVTVKNTDEDIVYSSSDSSVATVSDSGLITAVAKGEATITAKAGDISDTIKITVTEPAVTVVDVESVTLNKTEITLEAGTTETLTATVLPENATDKTVTWETSNVEVATIANGVVTAVAKGEATITAKAGEKTATCKVIVNEPAPAYLTIAEAKDKAVGEAITVRGEVTAVSGKSAYIADQTGGFYVYNWSFNGDDTAIVDGSWVLGMNVEVHGQIAEFSNLIQISNWDDARIEGTYAIEIEDDVTPMSPIALTEEGYKALTEKDAGNLYKFTAEYVSGTPSTGNNVSTTWKLGSTNITLRTDKYDKVGIDETFVAGEVYEITTPLSWYGSNPQFAFLGTGTVLDKQVIPLESLSLLASKTEAVVGEIVTLTATKTPSNADGEVKFSITSDESEIATLDGNELTASGAGTVKVQASIGEVKSSELSITFTTPSEHGTATYDMSKGWDTAKFSNSNIVAAFGAEAVAYATPGDIAETFSSISVLNGQNIVKTLSISGRIAVPVDNSNMSGLIIGASDTIQNIPSQATNGTPILNFVFDKPVEKMTLKIIPCATSTKIDFTINDEQHLQESITSTGGIESVVTIEHTFAESTTECVLKNAWGKGTQFAIVGISFTY